MDDLAFSPGLGGRKIMNGHNYTPEEVLFLKENVTGCSYQDLTDRFNNKFNLSLSLKAIRSTCKRLNLKNGLNACFKKGNKPFNKGKKWDDYMSPEAQANSRKTCFDKNHTVNNSDHNHRCVGDEWTDTDGYTYVKTSTRNPKLSNKRFWKLKHHIIWEQHYGPIPNSHKIIFADGDKSNFDINNLILVSNAEEAIINKQGLYYRGHPELTKSGAMIAKVLNGINLKKKEKKDGKKHINRHA